jgi:hypothetical protein
VAAGVRLVVAATADGECERQADERERRMSHGGSAWSGKGHCRRGSGRRVYPSAASEFSLEMAGHVLPKPESDPLTPPGDAG